MNESEDVIVNGYMDKNIHDIIYPYNSNEPLGKNIIRWNNDSQNWEALVIDTSDPSLPN